MRKKEILIFCLLAGLLIIKNMPCWTKAVIPFHDTLCCYQGFHIFYNELFTNGELCQWLPYHGYGVQSSLVFHVFLSPPAYLVGVLGYLLGIQDTLFLFNTAIFLQEFILLVGMFFLARRNFTHLITILFVCIIPIFCVITLHQPGLNHFIFYSLPLEVYFLILFFDKMKLYYLLISTTIFSISLLGTCGYAISVQMLILNLFFASLFVSYGRSAITCFKYEKNDIIISSFLVLFLSVFIVSYIILILDIKSEIIGLSPGRELGDSFSSLETFLSYGGKVSKQEILDLFTPTLYKTDIAIYTGTATILFCLVSFFSKKNKIYYSFVVVSTILIFFACGDRTFVAETLYRWYPGMKYFRHIRYVLVYLVVLLPLIAGFGLEFFIEKIKEHQSVQRARIVAGVVVMLTVIQLGFYQQQIFKHARQITQTAGPISEDVFHVARMEYQPTRTEQPMTRRALDTQFLLTVPESATYALYYSFMNWDSAIPQLRLDYMNQFVFEWITQKGGTVSAWDSQIPAEKSLRRSLGYHEDKLMVLKPSVEGQYEDGDPVAVDLSINKFTSNSIDLDYFLEGDTPSFLYYSDAWSSHWKAKVDGLLTPIKKAHHAFKAIQIPPGQHHVSFFYDNAKVRIAKYMLIVFGLSGMLSFFYWLFWFSFFKQYRAGRVPAC